MSDKNINKTLESVITESVLMNEGRGGPPANRVRSETLTLALELSNAQDVVERVLKRITKLENSKDDVKSLNGVSKSLSDVMWNLNYGKTGGHDERVNKK